MSSPSETGDRRSQIDLVVFDLGRVLIRICDGWQHACAVAGIAAGPKGRLADDAHAAVHAALCANELGETDLHDFARAAAPHLGISVDEFVAMHAAYTIGPFDGAPQLLDDLRAARVRTACLSNTCASHWRLIGNTAAPDGLPLDKFDHCFASHLVRLRKPDERIYAHVEREAAVAPDRIVFFDDVAENVAAAAARGWHAHRVRTDAEPIGQLRRALRAHGLL